MRVNKIRSAVGCDRVKVLTGSENDRKMRVNARWLFSLDPDCLIADLREACGVDPKGAKNYGGWGGFQSHYLRALCSLYESYLGVDEEIAGNAREKALYMAHALTECQEKSGEKAPLGIFPPEADQAALDRTRLVTDSIYSHTHINSIFYGFHKTMVAWIMTYRTFGDESSLRSAQLMAKRVREILLPFTQAEREKMTDSRRISDFFSEAGGIMDAFLMLYEDTREECWMETAAFFRRSWFDEMFLRGEEMLGRNMEHANSEMPYVESLVDLYGAAGDEDALKVASAYIRNSYLEHELPQGTVSGRSAYQDYQAELYNYPKRVYYHIMDTKKHRSISSGESCCAHNLNRVCEKLLEYDDDPLYADAWDRRYVNAVLAQQNPDTGMFIYHLNLKNHAYKMWGYPYKSFWCCYGTGAEVFSSITHGAFYEDGNRVMTCLYMPCVYRHPSGITVIEKTDYPDSDHVEFEFRGEGKLEFVLRIPGWLSDNARITLPDGTVETAAPGENTYTVERVFRDGDKVLLDLPFSLRAVRMPDREEYVSVYYGPNLLVVTATGDHVFVGNANELLAALEPTGVPCEFAANFEGSGSGAGTHIVKPIRKIRDEVYCGYFRLSKPAKRQLTDSLSVGDPGDCEAHGMHGVGIDRRMKNGKAILSTTLTFFSDTGEIIFDMKSDPAREMLLRLTFDGSVQNYIHQFSGHMVNPLFDLQVLHEGEWKPFSTKSLEGDFEGEYCYENFVIPKKWTEGKETLSIRLLARNFHEIPGVIDGITDEIELYYVADTEETDTFRGDRRFVPNAQGLY